MKRHFAAGLIAIATLTALPGVAASQDQKDPQALASEGMQSLLQAMELMLMAIPQYEAPFINENGDIIIRRKNPLENRTTPGRPAPEKKEKAI
ncbi:MAG: hypothetical protein GKS00_16590 [Alphaproteobacteria bacterium]|nr:hypothetical protein [Alphaproteobacteria bacterium]